MSNNDSYVTEVDSEAQSQDEVYSPTDPLYANQQQFLALGDIQQIWTEFTGDGVKTGVVDSRIQDDHEDLTANYDFEYENPYIDPSFQPNWHGTVVAGIMSSTEGNDIGGVGIAFDSSVSQVSSWGDFWPHVPETSFVGMEELDVVNHSWGPPQKFQLNQQTVAAKILEYFEESIEIGRDGLGTVHMEAAGNANRSASGNVLESARYTFHVAALEPVNDDDGYQGSELASYSNHGSTLYVSAPTNNLATTINDEYSSLDGTSGASPAASGVVALMMDANEQLGWRDVGSILSVSSTEIGSGVGGESYPYEDFKWFYNDAENWNGGGMHYSQDYGYGAVDAYNAVRMAEVWGLFSGPNVSANEAAITFEMGEISDSVIEAYGEKTYSFVIDDNILLEYIDAIVNVDIDALTWLDMYLISPDGTEYQFFNDTVEETSFAGGGEFPFGMNAARGTMSAGEWQLRLENSGDESPATTEVQDALLLGFKFIGYGEDGTEEGASFEDNVYHFTDEIFETLERDPTRTELSDKDAGTDWINMSAITGDVSLQLADNRSSKIDGQNVLLIESGSLIESAVVGDGDDVINGNSLQNELYGMRGNDTIYGRSGADFIDGGQGSDLLYGNARGDSIDGGTGNDRIFGGGGGDLLDGGDGDDNIDGGAGKDKIDGGSGTDLINGGSGQDKILGGDGSDQLRGEDGNDTIVGGPGGDEIDGGSGNDILYGSNGGDRLTGGEGNDYLNGGNGNADVASWAGAISEFELVYDNATDRVTVKHVNPSANSEGNDTVLRVENFEFAGVVYTKSAIIEMASGDQPATQENAAGDEPMIDTELEQLISIAEQEISTTLTTSTGFVLSIDEANAENALIPALEIIQNTGTDNASSDTVKDFFDAAATMAVYAEENPPALNELTEADLLRFISHADQQSFEPVVQETSDAMLDWNAGW